MPGGKFIRGTPTCIKGFDLVFGTGKKPKARKGRPKKVTPESLQVEAIELVCKAVLFVIIYILLRIFF